MASYKFATIVCVAILALSLSGCMTASKLTPETAHQLMSDFHNAGCGGSVDLNAGAAAGQLGGEGHITLSLHGECPVGDKPAVVPLSEIDKILTPTP